MDLYLGVDVGTTQIKVAALAPDGARRVARAPTPIGSDGAGPVHEPQAILESVRALAREAVSSFPTGRVRALAVASVGEEGVMLDGEGAVLYPALAWYGRRRSARGERFSADHDAAATYAVAGLPQDPIHTLFHWAWLGDHAPAALGAMRAWLDLGGYVAFALSGERAMSPSQASRTHLWSPFRQEWQEEWAVAVGASAGVLPPVVPSGTVLGPLLPQALPGVARHPDAVVAVGGHDHAVGAWAAGVRTAGTVLDSLGTAEALYALAGPDAVASEAGRLASIQHGRAVVARGESPRYVQAALHTGAGLAALSRLLDRPLESLEEEARRVPPGAGGMRFCAPTWADEPRGAFLGVPLEVTPGAFLRAVLEGWARASVDALRALCREGGFEPAAVRAIGGGARLGLGLAIRASMLSCPLEVVEEPELVALGAALLARAAVEPAALAPALAVRPVAPVPGWREAYAADGSG